MEGISVSMYKGLRKYYRRKRGYERVDGSGRRKGTPIQLGSRRRRVWRFKIKPKIQILRKLSPKRFLRWLRDAYVNMMLSFANSRVMTGPLAGYGGLGDRTNGFAGLQGRRQVKEYDGKMLLEIYNSLVLAQGHRVSHEAANLGSQTATTLCQSNS